MQWKYATLVAFALTCCWLQLTQATDSNYPSIDIDKRCCDSTAQHFTSWVLGNDLSGPQTNATHTFAITNYPGTNITCTITQTFPTNADSTIHLKCDWANKNGLGKYNLAMDGVWVETTVPVEQPNTNGAMSLSISGLTTGPHTITTYHNRIWTNLSYGAMSKCLVSADGVLMATVTPSFVATNDNDCAFAFFTVNAIDGQPVVVNFDPDHSGPLDNVILTGFEIDRPTSPGSTAVLPVPADGDEHIFANNDDPIPGSAGTGYTTLSWTPSQFAVSNDVYFGTNSATVASATHASPEFRGSLTTNVWSTATNLDSALTYYWRVDEVTTSGVYTGFVWQFRTRHLGFPGAEGYGRFARGGRGGRVIEVTNLLDYQTNEAVIAGSYRAAIEATGPRTVVFRVSGLIKLKRPCTINATNGFITIAGQTAPGEGICLSQYPAGITSCSDVNMRFIRCRLGDYNQGTDKDGIGLGNSNHSIIDHCSISWTMDEASSSRQSGAVGSGSANITFQHNIISEALNYSYHYDDDLRQQTGCTNCFQPHAFAASISGEIASYHHNLIAHCTQRNWSMAGGFAQGNRYAGSLDIRNNVVYNWTDKTTDGGVARCNYVKNYYKPYPPNPYKVWLLRLDPIDTNNAVVPQYYVDGNVMEGKNYDTNNWQLGTAIFVGNGSNAANAAELNIVHTNAEIYPSYVTTQTAREAFKSVLSDVGCNLPVADVIDQRVIREVRDGTWHYIGTNGPNYTINGVPQPQSAGPNYPGFIDTQTDVHDVATNSPNYPWPPYDTYNVEPDTDHDGLPDWWEVIHGTNPNSPPNDFSDSNADPDGDGYTALEDYLNWLAAPHTTCAQDSYVDVDLSQYTVGFTNSPVHSVFSPTNGGVVLLGDGKTARFTPTSGFSGLGSFSFAVVDAESSTLTNTVGVRVTPTPPPLTDFEQWQIDYFSSTNNPDADPNFDADGDGQNNMAEFLSGTDPTNSLSALRIISATRQSNDVTVTWRTVGGRTNAVQATSGDTNGGYTTNSFSDISGSLIIPGSGDVTASYTDNGGATNIPSRFYRVRLIP
ncbi:MAG TPA: T9SS C-terminal target domain-containing protein [Verrucomicrobiae bacterium]|nr:T9SS C-terminal target domain-containing protein [Verrucomicrobiae bacterium]